MKLKEHLEKPGVERSLAIHLEHVDMPAFAALLGSIEKAEIAG
jgi:hypothetical protein